MGKSTKVYAFRDSFMYEGKQYDFKADTEKELGEKMANKMRDLKEGKNVISKNMTVNAWFDEYMETYKRKSVSPETYDGYYTRYNSKIKPFIGTMKISTVKEAHCQKVINSMEGLSKNYISKVIYTMNEMFKRAKKNHLTLDNPAADLEKIDAEDGKRRAITETERKYTYLVAQYHRAGLWLLTIMLAGLRPGEAAALQGRNLDFERKRIIIEFALKTKDKRLGKTKTEAGKREVPMPPELIEKYKALNLGPFDFVFTNTVGKRLSKSDMRKMWLNFKKEMNIAMGCKVKKNKLLPLNYEAVDRNGMEPLYPVASDLVPYCYRHTYATDMRSAGVATDDMVPVMGHEDKEVTGIYLHESEAAFLRVQKKMAEYQSSLLKKMEENSDTESNMESTPQTVGK